MRAELRPSSLGEILDRTAQMYRSHFVLYFEIATVSYAVVLVLNLLSSVLLFSHHQHAPDHVDVYVQRLVSHAHRFSGAGIYVSGGIRVIAILPVAIGMAAVMRAVAMNYLGQSTTIRDAYAGMRRRWYRYVLIMVAMYAYAILPVLVVLGVTAALVVAVPVSFGRNLLVGFMVVLVFAAFIAACWWMLRWLLAVPASLMEDLPVHRSLKRSALLTRGARGRIFVMLLLVVAVMMVIQYAIQIPMFVLLWKSKGVLTLTTQIVASFGTFLSGSFVLPIYSIALTLFYYDQRIRKEGYDVEWLMEQAAVAPSISSAGTVAPGVGVPASLTPQTDPPGPVV